MTTDPFSVLCEAAQGWGVAMGAEQLGLLRRYVSQVIAFNERTNITADGDLDTVVLRHVADGLACIPVLRDLALQNNGRPGSTSSPELLDAGSGAGFIGISVKIAWPHARVTLMEPRLRRFAFLSAVAAELALKDIRLLRKSAQDLGPRGPRFDFVLSRALAPIPKALAWTLPLAKAGGHVVVYQSGAPDPATPALRRVLSRAGAAWLGARRYRRPAEETDRFLAVFSVNPAPGVGEIGARGRAKGCSPHRTASAEGDPH
ncbi:MAG: 16S rRNA (guanine(527)-N(7))-methyltransferase RsmG [Elusimicrobia bacterium]|nr:16S rRNA (guanine(527)-N(7))-methyltransferase RsmG [Elusimicrobiota bacterium]